MDWKATSITVLSGLLGSLAHGCAMELEGGDAKPIQGAESALSDDGAQHPGCRGFRNACREGNELMCERYSKQCEVRIGVIGDSLSDEYQGSVALPGLQWTEQVQDDVRISLGTHEGNPAVRGEPRNTGYGLNWARFGQAALGIQWSTPEYRDQYPEVIQNDPRLVTIGSFDAQIDGLGAQIAAGEVDVALVWIGHNDLFIRQSIGFEQDGGEQAFYGALIGRIVGAAATLRAYASADPDNIKAKVAIIGLAGDASALNPALSAAAAAQGIAFIDPFNTLINQIVTEQATTGSYDVGGTPLMPFDITLSPFTVTPITASLADLSPPSSPATGPCGFSPLVNGVACSTPAYAEPFRHYDGVHPNTIYMGLIGNQIIADVNDTFGFAMRTISDDQLLDNAGL